MPESPRVCPMLSYHDARGALDFLKQAFGFEELLRLDMPDGRIGHAEVGCPGVRIMIASEYPELGLASPRSLETRYSQLYVVVDDVDAHYEKARSAGAVIVSVPEEDHGDRLYRANDPEGHRWIFAQPLGE
ncbi:MAG: VOC family protein [Proteobacteria bacterium]|nr:VOC family protein [Pseudomonadota bacterium]